MISNWAVRSAERRASVWNGRLELVLDVWGEGRPVVFLHGAGGPPAQPDDFLATLAASFAVHVPHHPGTGKSDPADIYKLDDLFDLVMAYDELLDVLGLGEAALIGHSYGGMLACELACLRRDRVPKLVLIAPIGLWREDAPLSAVHWTSVLASDLPGLLAHDPGSPAVQRLFRSMGLAAGSTPEAQAEARARLMWARACVNKFIWPLPDRGLRKRIHRVSAPTLIIWGAQDAWVPAIYADEFARHLPTARVELVDGAGHLVHLERAELVAPLVVSFLQG